MEKIPANNVEDPFTLERFILAQRDSFDRALLEIKNGKKSSHWMWYIFPQLRGLGFSPTAQFYGISGIAEAQAYIDHNILGPRLITICEATIAIAGKSAMEIFGRPDDLKLRSCATLFGIISHPDSVFHRITDKYFEGISCRNTLELLGI